MLSREATLQAAAEAIAREAMGKTKRWTGRRDPGDQGRAYNAEEDPLAFVCLTEWIIAVAKRYAGEK